MKVFTWGDLSAAIHGLKAYTGHGLLTPVITARLLLLYRSAFSVYMDREGPQAFIDQFHIYILLFAPFSHCSLSSDTCCLCQLTFLVFRGLSMYCPSPTEMTPPVGE